MYLQIHEELPEHPKSLALCDSLDEPLAWAYPIRLWMWCAKYAKDGVLSKFTAAQIERGAGWVGERGKLLAAMVDAGFLDRAGDALTVHDWMHYTGADIVKMATDAERKRRGRLKNGAEDPKDIPAPSDGCPQDGARTARVSNQSKADQSEANPPAPARDPRAWRTGLEDRWRIKSGAKGMQFPGVTTLADEVQAAAEQLGRDPLDVFDGVIAEFVKWRGECSPGKAPNLSPAKVVEHFPRLIERWTGTAPKGKMDTATGYDRADGSPRPMSLVPADDVLAAARPAEVAPMPDDVRAMLRQIANGKAAP